MKIEIRRYQSSDLKEIETLFYQTVHRVNRADYREEQLDAWADGRIDENAWDRSFQEHITLVAVKDGRIAGFGDMDRTGYLDRLYVHWEEQRKGIASALCDRLEQEAESERFVTHASITAKPFFEKRGYRVVKEQEVIRKGVALTNYVMEKQTDSKEKEKPMRKLVRDKIPEIIKEHGEQPRIRILEAAEYKKELEKKLDEETAEYHDSKELEELADILEVVYALCEADGHTRKELYQICEKKREKRGGFAGKIFLEGKDNDHL